jgi:hypothetical protein
VLVAVVVVLIVLAMAGLVGLFAGRGSSRVVAGAADTVDSAVSTGASAKG